MKYLCRQIPILIFTLLAVTGSSQPYFAEGGIGIGNVAEGKHHLGKSEIYFSLYKTFTFGKLGLDFASGGNFIPGETGSLVDNPEIISPNDSRFGTILLIYRASLKKQVFIEPRLGYASLRAYVHTDDRAQLKQPNLSLGLGLGTSFDNVTLSLRYQYFGKTAEYTGARGQVEVQSLAKPISMILFRAGFRLGLGKREK